VLPAWARLLAWFPVIGTASCPRCHSEVFKDFSEISQAGYGIRGKGVLRVWPVSAGSRKARWNASTNNVETLLKFPDFVLTGWYGVTFTLNPDGSIVFLKEASNRDLYALDLDLP